MRQDTVDIIAQATPAELAAGIVFNRAVRTGPQTVLRDGRVRFPVYIDRGSDAAPEPRRRSEPAVTKHGLDNGVSKI